MAQGRTSADASDVIAPKWLILPTIPTAGQASTAPPGTICMSGSNLVFFDGTNWKIVTAT